MGMNGVIRKGIPACCGVRPPLVPLHAAQAATVFSHVERPPWALGLTWSTVAAARPQYPHMYLSLIGTFGIAKVSGLSRYFHSAVTYLVSLSAAGRGQP